MKFAHEESWKPVDMPGSDRWLYRNGRWINLASATHYFYLGLWKEFAFRLLPHMDDLISSQPSVPEKSSTGAMKDVPKSMATLATRCMK